MSIETLPLKKGEVAFTWFNNFSGVALRTSTKTFIMDAADIDPKVFTKVDAVLITHEHWDHLDANIVQEIHRRTQCVVAADSTLAKRLGDSVEANKLSEMHVGKEMKLYNITIQAEAFSHPVAVPYHAPGAERKKFAELIAKETPNVTCMVVEQGNPAKYP